MPGNDSQQGEVQDKSSLNKHNNNLLVGDSIFANLLIILGESLIVIQWLKFTVTMNKRNFIYMQAVDRLAAIANSRSCPGQRLI